MWSLRNTKNNQQLYSIRHTWKCTFETFSWRNCVSITVLCVGWAFLTGIIETERYFTKSCMTDYTLNYCASKFVSNFEMPLKSTRKNWLRALKIGFDWPAGRPSEKRQMFEGFKLKPKFQFLYQIKFQYPKNTSEEQLNSNIYQLPIKTHFEHMRDPWNFHYYCVSPTSDHFISLTICLSGLCYKYFNRTKYTN